jgi:hypothetical protein
MRERLPIGDRIEKAQEDGIDHVLLEDAQHKIIASLVENYAGFLRPHYAILEFVDAISGAPEVEVKEEPQTD